MSTPERQQDPGEHGYGGVKQEFPAADEERDETPQERADKDIAERRRLAEEQSEEQAEPVDEHPPPTDDIESLEDDEEIQGSDNPVV
jgi:hypothetical protein